MNAIAHTATLPLPPALERPSGVARRRIHVCDHELRVEALDVFNALLRRLEPRRPALEGDQIATAARTLLDGGGDATPPCIRQRLNRLRTAACLATDAAWRAADEVVERIAAATAYVAASADLIPDALPTVGRLDDAILADSVLRGLAGELDAYADFCDARLAARAACDHGFDRDAWRELRDAQARAYHHARRVRETSYLPPPARRFLVQ